MAWSSGRGFRDCESDGFGGDIQSFSAGYPVTHRKLIQQTIAGGIRFYDFQCSAQKPVSVMSLFDQRLIEAHRRSIAFAMKELERFAAVRIRSGANVNTQNHEVTGT
ncbi:MAG: relaxase domain-containing protein [Lentisphaeria bacterium]|nr:relaxase domain-containing protein [Lentisphaeria bacterium]